MLNQMAPFRFKELISDPFMRQNSQCIYIGVLRDIFDLSFVNIKLQIDSRENGLECSFNSTWNCVTDETQHNSLLLTFCDRTSRTVGRNTLKKNCFIRLFLNSNKNNFHSIFCIFQL